MNSQKTQSNRPKGLHRSFQEHATVICCRFSYLLFGLAMVWAVLQPADSTAVFLGDALPQNFCWILIAVLTSLLGVLDRRFLKVSKVEWIILGLLALWLLLSTLRATGLCNPRTCWNGFWHLTALGCFYCSARCLLGNAKVVGMTVLILIAAGIGLSIVGLHQILIDFPEQRAIYHQEPDKVLSELGLDAPPGSPQRSRYEARLMSPEPLATFSLTNSLAVFLSAALVLALGTTARYWFGYGERLEESTTPKSQGRKRTVSQVRIQRPGSGGRQVTTPSLWTGLSLAITVCLILSVWMATRSRIAYLAVILTVLACWIQQFRNRSSQSQSVTESPKATKQSTIPIWVWPAMSVIAVGASISVGLINRTILDDALRSALFRGEYWVASLRMFSDHWLLGIGLGNFQAYYPRYMLPTASETIADPHNWIFDLLVNCSLPVTLVLVLGVARVFLSPLRSRALKSVQQFQNDTPSISGGQGVFEVEFSQHRWLAIGAVTGLLAVASVMWLFGWNLPLTLGACLVATVLLIPVWTLLRTTLMVDPWVNHWAALAMLLCLLVSGSWQATGIIVPLLCLFCCCLAAEQWTSVEGNETELNAVPSVEGSQKPCTSTRLGFSGPLRLAVFVVVLAAFVRQGWNPVLLSETVGTSPQTSLDGQINSIQMAMRLDPLESKWDRYYLVLMTQWSAQAPDAKTFQARAAQAVDAMRIWTEREPINFLTWQTAGQCGLDLASAAQRLGVSHQEYLGISVDGHEKAVQAFPNSVQLRLQLAVSLFLGGKMEKAASELEKADELDRTTPHSDRKLVNQLVWLPIFAELPEFSRTSSGQWCQAEPVVNWLRNQL